MNFTCSRCFDSARASSSLALKVNVTNLNDEYYLEQLHTWHVVPAAGRTITFAVNAAY